PALAAAAFLGLFTAGVLLGAHARTASGATATTVATDPQAAFLDLAAAAPMEAVAEAQRWTRTHPDDHAGQVVRLAAVVERLPADAPVRQELAAQLRRARERLEEQAFERLELLRASAIELVEAGRVDEARARLATYPPVYRMTTAWEAYEELRRELGRLERP
ncbi:MAG: hypothetical protein KF878_24010, partial [Planctomycetes bacterium]|nr:hypothetical protein [Planctomycetota bacterium]